MKEKKWLLIFLGIVALTQSNMFIDYESTPSLLGFPQWLWWFISFHALLVIALYRFVKESEEL